ncbi:MAG: hypothetical protein KDK70_42585, partial [Myxococcales bacterium]|nr:hypothetical protein [Myxococcales bacterium]
MIIGIACEDDGHFSATTHIIDATLLAAHPWLDGVIEECRGWRGLDESEPWYKYSPRDAHDLRPVTLGDGLVVKPHGRINGRRLELEAGMWRKVLLLFCHRTPRP